MCLCVLQGIDPRFSEYAPKQEATIGAAARELNELRERRLIPPEWTKTVTLEFPGSTGDPWARFINPKTVNAKTGIGFVGFPPLEPRDAVVAAAYGWPVDLTDEQILGKLLALKLERAATEAKTAAAPKTRKPQREKHADELI